MVIATASPVNASLNSTILMKSVTMRFPFGASQMPVGCAIKLLSAKMVVLPKPQLVMRTIAAPQKSETKL